MSVQQTLRPSTCARATDRPQALQRMGSIAHACRTCTRTQISCYGRLASVAAGRWLVQGHRLPGSTAHLGKGVSAPIPARSHQLAFNTHRCFASVNASNADRKIKYLYDGGCKVCQTFKSSLQSQEGPKDRINYVNIAEDSYSPADNNNVSYDDAMSTIHAITSEGDTLKGPDAVRELFGKAGSTTSFLAEASKQPGFDQLFGSAYEFLSERRFQISDAAQKAQKTLGAE